MWRGTGRQEPGRKEGGVQKGGKEKAGSIILKLVGTGTNIFLQNKMQHCVIFCTKIVQRGGNHYRKVQEPEARDIEREGSCRALSTFTHLHMQLNL